MINYSKLIKPTYGTTNVEVKDFIKDIKNKLRFAKVDSKHFNHKCVRFVITIDENDQLWISGYTKDDL
jgi:hypothetical protein